MNIYLPDLNLKSINRKLLFWLTRPFYTPDGWSNQSEDRLKWGVSSEFQYVNNIDQAQVYFIPLPINTYKKTQLEQIDNLCKVKGIKAYGYVSGDFGELFGSYDNLVIYRMGGFKSLSGNTYHGFPVPLSDQLKVIYKQQEISVREKQDQPVVGFCGHASLSKYKLLKENFKFILENLKRFISQPLRKDYEPLFGSAYHRAQLLKTLSQDSGIVDNFILRKQYRAGAVTTEQRSQTTKEYFENIKNSDYVLCVRGGGNFSVRLYETLMFGRIPIFINTDCLLPFEEVIPWKSHVVWVEWKDRDKIAEIVKDFHQSISSEAFKELQLKNRALWQETLTVKGMLEMIQ